MAKNAAGHVETRLGFVLLIGAALIVGVAIAADGQVARALNGIGGLVWIAAGYKVVTPLRLEHTFTRNLLLVIGLTIALVLLVRPSDYLLAIASFAGAGLAVAVAAQSRPVEWALAVPGLWLPVHLSVAIARVAERSVRDLPTHVRTDPPPTAALVPLAMVLSAWIAGRFVEVVRRLDVPLIRVRHEPVD
jgi:hypothetical protein